MNEIHKILPTFEIWLADQSPVKVEIISSSEYLPKDKATFDLIFIVQPAVQLLPSRARRELPLLSPKLSYASAGETCTERYIHPKICYHLGVREKC